jgi:hypothetical protein
MLISTNLIKFWGWSLTESQPLKDRRIADPLFDRRSGDDRRESYKLGYFSQGGIERRKGIERRQKAERRDQCARTNKWSSICAISKSAVE